MARSDNKYAKKPSVVGPDEIRRLNQMADENGAVLIDPEKAARDAAIEDQQYHAVFEMATQIYMQMAAQGGGTPAVMIRAAYEYAVVWVDSHATMLDLEALKARVDDVRDGLKERSGG